MEKYIIEVFDKTTDELVFETTTTTKASALAEIDMWDPNDYEINFFENHYSEETA